MYRPILPSRAWVPSVPMLWIPRVEFAGWYPCCCVCDGYYPCSYVARNCKPTTYTVAFSGWPSTPTDCTGRDGEFTVREDDACAWQLLLGAPVFGEINLWFTSDKYLNVRYILGLFDVYTWQYEYTGDGYQDACAIDELEIPFLSQGGSVSCDGSGVTCVVTSNQD